MRFQVSGFRCQTSGYSFLAAAEGCPMLIFVICHLTSDLCPLNPESLNTDT